MPSEKVTLIGKVVSEAENFIHNETSITALTFESNVKQFDNMFDCERTRRVYTVIFCGLYSLSVTNVVHVGDVCQISGSVKEFISSDMKQDTTKYLIADHITVLAKEAS